MRPLAGWYPGDRIVFAGLEIVVMITVLVALTWVVEQLVARRCAARRSALWLLALISVLLTPGLVGLGHLLPWRIAVLPPPDALSAPLAVPPQVSSATLPALTDVAASAEAQKPPRSPNRSEPARRLRPGAASAPFFPRAIYRALTVLRCHREVQGRQRSTLPNRARCRRTSHIHSLRSRCSLGQWEAFISVHGCSAVGGDCARSAVVCDHWLSSAGPRN